MGALIEPLAVSWHAVKISHFKPGSTVLIIGAGPVSIPSAARPSARPCPRLTSRADRATAPKDPQVRFVSRTLQADGALTTVRIRAEGASWIGVSEPAAARRVTALKLHASAVFDPRADDVIAETYRATKGGADVVFDCAGIQASFDAALGAVRTQGNVVEVAVWEKDPVLKMGALQTKEAVLTGEPTFC